MNSAVHQFVVSKNDPSFATYCRLRNQVRTFMLHRIESAEMLEDKFKPNPEIYEAAKPGKFLQFKQIPDITIRFHRSIHDSPYAKPLHIDQEIDFDETSEYLTLHLPGCSEEVLIPWVLSQLGKAEIIEPEFLREKVCQSAHVLVSVHCPER